VGGLIGLFLRGGRVGVIKIGALSSGGGGVVVVGLTVLYRRGGGGVGVM
jgi:hypothetical protein